MIFVSLRVLRAFVVNRRSNQLRSDESRQLLTSERLNGIDGRKSGTAADYNYSDANKNSGITWNEAQFKEYIADPKAKIPGTKMAFAGIKKESDINDLWAYVSQFDKDGKIKSK